MVRKIIKINENKCNGCGLCVSACQEGAIDLVDGKAKLVREDYCDGLGNCLPVCPTEAITFEEREVDSINMESEGCSSSETLACGCPSMEAKVIERDPCLKAEQKQAESAKAMNISAETHLNQWPVKIKLIAPNAANLKNAHLLIAADCTAFAYGNFHSEYMKNKITIICCPKLDETDYSEKLTAILKTNNIKSVTIVRMVVPCCGIDNMVKTALQNCGKLIPWQIVTISTDGNILEQ